ncbi:MAG: hypothetical protein ABSG81_06720 [Acidimicrobiales bacterium]
MRRVTRGIGRLVLRAGVAAVVVAVGRAALGRLTKAPGEGLRGGSFDTWPPVPPAPGRQPPNGSALPVDG